MLTQCNVTATVSHSPHFLFFHFVCDYPDKSHAHTAARHSAVLYFYMKAYNYRYETKY